MADVDRLRLRSGDAVMVFDSSLVVVAWNCAAEQLTGLNAQEAVGRYCWEALGGVDQQGHLFCHPGCSIAQACKGGRAVRSTSLSIRTLSGRKVVNLATVSLDCDGRPLHVHVMCEAKPPVETVRPSQVETTALLTPRQYQVLTLLAEGLSTAEIASSLTISGATARNHIRAILAALDCHSRLEAVARARSLGLV